VHLVSLSCECAFGLVFWNGAVSASISRDNITVCNCEEGVLYSTCLWSIINFLMASREAGSAIVLSVK